MKVIGAGFGRTGTLSLKTALELLGAGPCYHMAELMKHPEHLDTWEARVRGEVVDWRALFAGWGSTVDWPACSFYEEILAAHPEAKVLLSVRDPARWHQSCMETIYKVGHIFPLGRMMPYLPRLGRPTRVAMRLIWDQTFGGRFPDREHAISVFNAHYDEVRAKVPPEKLLVYEVKEGWGPLCEFLGVPVPDEPFPHVNDSESVKGAIRVMNGIAWALLLSPLVLLACWLIF